MRKLLDRSIGVSGSASGAVHARRSKEASVDFVEAVEEAFVAAVVEAAQFAQW